MVECWTVNSVTSVIVGSIPTLLTNRSTMKNGSQLAEKLWNSLKDYIPDDQLQKEARKIIELFEDYGVCEWDIGLGNDLWQTAWPDYEGDNYQ